MTNAGTPAFHSWRDVCLSAGAEVALALEPANGALRVRGIAFAGERSRALATTLARRGQGFELHRTTLTLPDLGALNEAIAMGRSGSLDLAPEIASTAPSELARLAASLGLRHAALVQAMDSRWRRRIGLFLFERPIDELELVRIERLVRTTPWPEGDDDPFFAPASAGELDLAEVGAALTAAAVGADIERAYRALRAVVGADRIVLLRPDVERGEIEVLAQWPLRSVRSAPLVLGTRVAVRREPLAALAAGDVLPFGRIPTGRTIEAGEAALLGAAFRSALYFAAPAAGGAPLILQAASHDAGQYGDDTIAAAIDGAALGGGTGGCAAACHRRRARRHRRGAGRRHRPGERDRPGAGDTGGAASLRREWRCASASARARRCASWRRVRSMPSRRGISSTPRPG